jgi:hypothetical protein
MLSYVTDKARFNETLYMKVLKERRQRGLYTFGDGSGIECPNHPLLNALIYNDHKVPGFIQKVGIHYFRGWYLLYILRNHNNSHCMNYVAKWRQTFHSEQELINTAMTFTDTSQIDMNALYDDMDIIRNE